MSDIVVNSRQKEHVVTVNISKGGVNVKAGASAASVLRFLLEQVEKAPETFVAPGTYDVELMAVVSTVTPDES